MSWFGISVVQLMFSTTALQTLLDFSPNIAHRNCIGSTVDWRYGLYISMQFDLFFFGLPANIEFPSLYYYVEWFRSLKLIQQLAHFIFSRMLYGLFKWSIHLFSHLEYSLYNFLPSCLCKYLPLTRILFPEQKIWQRFGNFSLSFSIFHIIIHK